MVGFLEDSAGLDLESEALAQRDRRLLKYGADHLRGAVTAVVEALQAPHRARGYIRINALDTDYAFGDLHAVIARGVDGIVLPKLESVEQLFTADWIIGQLERERGSQHARAERHNPGNRARRDGHEITYRGSDHERRARDEAPETSLQPYRKHSR